LARVKVESTPRNGNLDDQIAQIDDFELGAAGQVDRVGADLDLGTGLGAGPQQLPD